MTQAEALQVLKLGVNVFLTGEPGSGKTHAIREYIGYLRKHGVRVAVTASTGIAATHIGGVTIHSYSGIGVRRKVTEREVAELARRKFLASRLRKVKVLIIDEISMLDANVLESIDLVMRGIRESIRPFGGVQVVVVGDFFQLPPVAVGQGELVEYAFESKAWQEAGFWVCYLSEQFRQDDEQLEAVLSMLRRREETERARQVLMKRVGEKQNGLFTRLYTHNYNVDRVNERMLGEIEGREAGYEMDCRGPQVLVEQLVRGCMSPERLVLKKGARVMFTKNNFEFGYVNGTLGEVVGFEGKLPVVETVAGDQLEVEPMEWSISEGERVLAKVRQVPLRLAWAITVHKSQGMSLDGAEVDLSGAFEFGQGYVAISRVRRLSGLYLLGLNERALEVNPGIVEEDGGFRSKSATALKRLGQIGREEVIKTQSRFILRNGGSWDKRLDEKSSRSGGSTLEETLKLFGAGKSVSEAASERGLKERTIVGHAVKLAQAGKMSKVQVKALVSAPARAQWPKIRAAFAEAGTEKLKPVYEQLGGRFGYDDLALARVIEEE